MAGRGSNTIQLRHYNERIVLQAIRAAGEASKAEIAREAGLTPPAVAAIVDALVDAGYVVANGRRFGGKGQPSTMYKLCRTGAFGIGIHIGRRSFDAMLIGLSGETFALSSSEYDFPNPGEIKRLGNSAIATFAKTVAGLSKDRLVGLGISAPYFIGGWDKELGFPASVIKLWKSIKIQDLFDEASDLQVFVENDASAAAMAELVYGAGRNYSDFLHVSLNTFVGAGLVLDGALQTGPHGNTAAFGPFLVTHSMLPTADQYSSRFSLLLHRASVYTLINYLNANGIEIKRARELQDLPQNAKPFIEAWVDDCADALAQAIIGSIAVLDVQAVIIDGLLPTSMLSDVVERVSKKFGELMPSGLVAPDICRGSLNSTASALGAAVLPIHAMFGPNTGVLMKGTADKKGVMVGSA